MVDVRLDGERVTATRPIENGTGENGASNSSFHFLAENIYRNATGIHARITLGLDTTILAWSVFNIERDEDRTKIGNKAHTLLPAPLKLVFPKDHLKHELDLFCLQLWDVYQGYYAIEDLAGKVNWEGIDFYLKPYLPKDSGTILFGPPGRGKSYVVLIMAVSMDSGESAWWDVGTPTKVLFVNLERSARSMRHRLARVNLALGYHENRSIQMLNARGHTLSDVKEAIKRAVGEKGIEVVLMDSISRAGMGDLNANDKVNGICDTLNNLCPTWMAIGHSPRGDDSHLFGGVHFDAAADVMIRLSSERQANSLGIGLDITKGNDLPDFPTEYLALDFDGETGLVNIRHPGNMEFTELALGQKRSLLVEVTEYLGVEGKASANTIAKGINKDRANVSRLLNGRSEFTRQGRDSTGILFALKESV